jgi:hypothetical protein
MKHEDWRKRPEKFVAITGCNSEANCLVENEKKNSDIKTSVKKFYYNNNLT